MTDAQRIGELRRELDRHSRLYYAENKPEISDREFDRMLAELAALEAKHPELVTPDSPTQRVGGQPIEGFRTVTHAERMMSIDNTYSEGDVREFDRRMRKALEGEEPRYVLEPKIDGLACNLRYEDGVLVLAATRGDGRKGDDITHNARVIPAIPLRLGKGAPKVLECRGEIYMPNSSFQRLNKARLEAGEELFANPRNAAAGAIKQLDPKQSRERGLSFFAHGIGQVQPLEVERYWDWLAMLRKLGVPTTPHTMFAETVDEVLAGIEAFGKIRGELAFQTDGMVVKVDDLKQRETLGATSKAPRWVVAFKYPAEQVQTVLHEVGWQVGRNGTLTPVAHLEAVFVAGSTVRRATLHNIDQIHRLGVHLGDTIVLEKAGEVIPYVVSVVEGKRPEGARAVAAPRKCPCCHTATVREEGTPFIYCPNFDCPDQVKERIRFFCARGQMDIEGLGTELVNGLVESGKVRTFADLYDLRREDISDLDREVNTEKDGQQVTRVQKVGDVIAGKVLAGVEASKDRGLSRVLAGLGISHFGNTASRRVAEWAGSLERIERASIDEIHSAAFANAGAKDNTSAEKLGTLIREAVEASKGTLFESKSENTEAVLARISEADPALGKRLNEDRRARLAEAFPTGDELASASAEKIAEALTAPVVASSLRKYLDSELGKKTLASLAKAGVKMTEKQTRVEGGPLQGQSVVVTGTLEKFEREEIERLIERLGGKASGSVSKKTSFVVAGEKAGSKLDKAKDLGVPVITEDEFIAKVGEDAIAAAKGSQ